MERPPIGQRNTRQRDAIAEVIRGAAGPLTAPEIAGRAQQEIPGLGIATVYRTLKLLQEAGRVRTVVLPSGETRYESEGLGHHHHFHCRVCDGVYDVETCHVAVPAGTRTEEGFVVEDHELTLYGVCSACA
jgi:Fur family ferric uptake transcriptional regulator